MENYLGKRSHTKKKKKNKKKEPNKCQLITKQRNIQTEESKTKMRKQEIGRR